MNESSGCLSGSLIDLPPVCFLNYHRRTLNRYEVFKIMSGSYYGESISCALSDHCCLNLISFFVSSPSLEMGNKRATASLFITGSQWYCSYAPSSPSYFISSLVLTYEIFNDLDFPLYDSLNILFISSLDIASIISATEKAFFILWSPHLGPLMPIHASCRAPSDRAPIHWSAPAINSCLYIAMPLSEGPPSTSEVRS